MTTKRQRVYFLTVILLIGLVWPVRLLADCLGKGIRRQANCLRIEHKVATFKQLELIGNRLRLTYKLMQATRQLVDLMVYFEEKHYAALRAQSVIGPVIDFDVRDSQIVSAEWKDRLQKLEVFFAHRKNEAYIFTSNRYFYAILDYRLDNEKTTDKSLAGMLEFLKQDLKTITMANIAIKKDIKKIRSRLVKVKEKIEQMQK